MAIGENFTENEIADAESVVNKNLNMDVSSFIGSGKSLELKNALSLLKKAKEIPDSKVNETSKFLTNFDQRCEKYGAAKRDLSEAREDEDLVCELKATMKQLSSKFLPVRHQAESLDSEITMQKKLLAENKAKRVRVGKRLDELAEQSAISKQALLRAEDNMKISTMKKEAADKTVSEFHILWESLKDLLSVKN